MRETLSVSMLAMFLEVLSASSLAAAAAWSSSGVSGADVSATLERPDGSEAQVALHGGNGEAERGGDLLAAETAEVPQLDHLRLALIDLGQLVQGLVDFDDVRRLSWGQHVCLVESDSAGGAAALLGLAGAGVIHQHQTHDACRDAEKVGPVLPLNRLRLVDQAEKGFINERRWLQGLVAPGAAEVSPGDGMKLAVDLRRELVQGSTVAPAPFEKQLGD